MSISRRQVGPVRQQSLPQVPRRQPVRRHRSTEDDSDNKQLKVFSSKADLVVKPNRPKTNFAWGEYQQNLTSKNLSSAPSRVEIMAKRIPCSLSRNNSTVLHSAVTNNHLNHNSSKNGNIKKCLWFSIPNYWCKLKWEVFQASAYSVLSCATFRMFEPLHNDLYCFLRTRYDSSPLMKHALNLYLLKSLDRSPAVTGQTFAVGIF